MFKMIVNNFIDIHYAGMYAITVAIGLIIMTISYNRILRSLVQIYVCMMHIKSQIMDILFTSLQV